MTMMSPGRAVSLEEIRVEGAPDRLDALFVVAVLFLAVALLEAVLWAMVFFAVAFLASALLAVVLFVGILFASPTAVTSFSLLLPREGRRTRLGRHRPQGFLPVGRPEG
jgi:hypothetical protein